MDLVLTFSICDLLDNNALNEGSSELVIIGETFEGVAIAGVDSVIIILDDD